MILFLNDNLPRMTDQTAYYTIVKDYPESILLTQFLIFICCLFVSLWLVIGILKRIAAQGRAFLVGIFIITIQIIVIALCLFSATALAGTMARTLLSGSLTESFPNVIYIFKEYITYPFYQWGRLQSFFSYYWNLAVIQE